MRTFIKCKENLIWIVCAMERVSKNIFSFTIGKQTNKTFNFVNTNLKLSQSKKIFSDKLKNYTFLIALHFPHHFYKKPSQKRKFIKNERVIKK